MSKPLTIWRDFWRCAHRGASGWAPENTLAAMHLALQMGANSLELDVHLSSDHEPVVLHDDTLDRTTNGSGLVRQYSLVELQTLDAGSWFGAEFSGEKLPTLKQVIDQTGKARLNIEIKGGADTAIVAEAVVAQIRANKAEKRSLVTSFDEQALQAVKQIAPQMPVGLIAFNRRPDLLAGDWEAVSCHYEFVDEPFVRAVRDSGKHLLVWTVNEIDEMRRLLNLDVDGMISNYPDRLQCACENRKTT